MRIVAGDGDPRHGTEATYRHHGCRCEACSAAHREWYAWAEIEYAHGTPRRALLCRCAKCRAEVSRYAHGTVRRAVYCKCAKCRAALRVDPPSPKTIPPPT